MAEDLDLDGGMGADVADLLPVQLPAEDHPLDAHGGAHLDPCQIVDRHLGRAVDRHMGGDLAAQLHHAPVLDDEGIHPGAGRRPDQVAQLLHLFVRNQGIEGQVYLHPPDMAIFQGFGQSLQGKVLGALPGVELSNPQIDGVRPVLHRRPQTLHRPRRGQ